MSGHRGLVDTNVFVSARNPAEAEHEDSRRFLDRVDAGEFRAIVSVISLSEIRAGLAAHEARAIWQPFTTHIVSSENFELAQVDLSVAELAGEIRERSKLTLPDALIVATSELLEADFIVSWERKLARKQSLAEVRTPNRAV